MAATSGEVIYKCASCLNFFDEDTFLNSHSCVESTDAADIDMTVVASPSTNLNDPSEKRKTLFQCDKCMIWFDDMEKYSNHPCVKETPISKPEQSTSDNDSNGSWGKSPTLLLLETYRENKQQVDSGRLRKNVLWRIISQKLASKGYQFKEAQVSGRWKTLCRLYKNFKDESRKSGSGRKDFTYEKEMNEIFGTDPAIEPVATISTSTSTGKSSKRKILVTDISEDDDDDVICSTQSKSDETPPEKKRRRSQASEVVDFLNQYAMKQEDRYAKEMDERRRQHNEKMELLRSLLQMKPDESGN